MAEQAHDQNNSGYETTDARVTPLAQTGLFLTVLVIASFVSMIVLFRALRLLPSQLFDDPVPPLVENRVASDAPRLQVDPPRQKFELAQSEAAILNSYGWIDVQVKVVHIPIERAIDLVSEGKMPLIRSASDTMSRPTTTFARSAIFSALTLPLLLAGQTGAQNYTQQLQKSIGIDQKLGDQIPLDLEFTDSNGKRTALRQYFGKKPIVLTLVYYECPMLCTQVLNSLLRAMNVLSFGIGTDFDVLTISVDPGETPELAAAKKAEYSKNYRGRDGSTGWHFLTGEEEQIKQLATAVGFRYEYDEDTDQYIHASGLMVLTPEGKLARYLYGIDYPPRDLRWGLVEAADGAIGNPVDQLLLLCYSYDPMTGKYGLYIRNSLRIGGLITVLAIVVFIVAMLKRERRNNLHQPQFN